MKNSNAKALLLWSMIFVLSLALTVFSWAHVRSSQDAGAVKLFSMDKEVRLALNWKGECIGSLRAQMSAGDEKVLNGEGAVHVSSHGRVVPVQFRGALVFNSLDQLSGTVARLTTQNLFEVSLESRGAKPITGKLSWSTSQEQTAPKLFFPFQLEGPVRVVKREGRYHFYIEGGMPEVLGHEMETQRKDLFARFPIAAEEIPLHEEGECKEPKALVLEDVYKELLLLKAATGPGPHRAQKGERNKP